MRRPRPRLIARALAGVGLASSLHAVPARAQPAADVTPPSVVTHVDASYPPSALEDRKHGDVVLTVTVDEHGHVSHVEVFESGGADLDQAAIIAVRQWTFVPAKRAGRPVASRIRIPFHFAPPAPPPELVMPSRPEAEIVPTVDPHGDHAHGGSEGAAGERHVRDVRVVGRAVAPSRGASDYRIHVGELGRVPRANAGELLRLAPGVFLTNEGGEGHAQRIYLRGFDAREGQDIELSVDGVPINDAGNPHGNGVAETQFIIPEVVHALRVLEGPFDPRQGNFAVAGSAEYQLGLDRRGSTVKYTRGSFGAERALLLWGPPGERTATFGAAELYRADGFGENRDAKRGSAIGQYEGLLGTQSSFRLTGAAYAVDYHSAGLLREDDVEAGRKGFYDTYDSNQGGASTRSHAAADVESRVEGTVLRQQLFTVSRSSRVRENFTGFLLDTQEAIQEPHGQRGDLLDTTMNATTFGGRGSARTELRALGRRHAVELGYFVRGDRVESRRQRIGADTGVPYKTESDFDSTLFDIGGYADTSLHVLPWLAFRGGVRGDLFAFDVLDRCAVQGVSQPSPTNPPGDASCLDQQRFGVHREPDQRSNTASTKLMPRGTLLFGPFSHFLLSLSYGIGVRSIDPNFVTQDVETPFATIRAVEGGVSYARSFEGVSVEAKSVFFSTHVDRDHVFSETEGRSVLGAGTTRTGWSGSARLSGNHFDQSANVTLVRSTFDDTGLLVPYAPDVVVRSDSTVFGDLPLRIDGTAVRGSIAAGAGYVGRRALPFGQRSDTIFTVDGSAAVGYRAVDVELSVTNLFGSRYRIAEYNFVSDFGSAPAPTLVPARHFAAGPPRAVFVSASLTWGGEP